LKQNAENYFKEHNIKDVRNMSPFTLFNTIFIIGGLFITYYLSMYSQISFMKKILFALLSGFFHHLSMVHLLHDASHSAYTRNPLVWRYFGYFGEILSGHSIYVWTHRHVFGHHIWTNVCGVDPDLGIYKCSPHRPIMNYRERVVIIPSWFQPFMYMFITLQMKIDDIFSYTRGSMENVKINNTGLYQSFIFWGGKLGYWGHRLFLPMYLGQGILSTLFLYSLAEAVSGTLFGYFSQITHISESCEWPIDRPIPRDWAEMQVLTATDYGHDSYVWTYLSGYLNYQVPHHLFPSVAPHYYADLCKK
jgi:linoleoyl-CoA desaturase